VYDIQIVNNLIHALVLCKVRAEAEETFDRRAYTTTKSFLYELRTEAEERTSGIHCNIASEIASTPIDGINTLFPLKIKKGFMKWVVE